MKVLRPGCKNALLLALYGTPNATKISCLYRLDRSPFSRLCRDVWIEARSRENIRSRDRASIPISQHGRENEERSSLHKQLIFVAFGVPYARVSFKYVRALHGWWHEIIAFPIPAKLRSILIYALTPTVRIMGSLHNYYDSYGRGRNLY